MIRKQFYITQEQDALLKRIAEDRGLTEAEVVRAALDTLLPFKYEQPGGMEAHRIREAAVMDRYVADEIRDSTGLALDQKLADAAWERELAFINSLGNGKTGGARTDAWKFDREELYEERLSKILRRH